MISCSICIFVIGLIISVASITYGREETFHYIHEHIFDEHMAINISMNVGLIAALLGIFFFTYASTVEEEIVKGNAIIGVNNIMEAVSPLINNKNKKKILNNMELPDASEEDLHEKKKNDKLMYDAYGKLLVILDIGLTIGFIISVIYKHNFMKILGLNLLIVFLVGCTEFTFLNFIPLQYVSMDTNFIRHTILTTLKSKILINNEPYPD
jgi:hypothetical protein